jgi:L,D-peptidoglycan transpeptidase YkuD (ErfK/YbiS/YcfS/YnhG family)
MTVLIFLWVLVAWAEEWSLPENSTQMILGIATSWKSSEIELQRYKRIENGEWIRVGEPIEARIGKKGLAWGKGLHPSVLSGPQKEEGDWRAPVGVFLLHSAYGYAETAPSGVTWSYEQVSERDLWVEDPHSPLYNQHVELPIGHKPSDWEISQQMKVGDDAHRIKIAVGHNVPPTVVKGAGSAIFIHIWRDNGTRPTSGCTAMSDENILEVLRWLEPKSEPIFVLLPQSVFTEKTGEWGLPN